MIIDFVKYILEYFKRKRRNITTHRLFSENTPNFESPPPDYLPIESYYDLSRIPGTTLDVGTLAKVLQSASNEILTYIRKQGIRCGCGHYIYSIERVVTESFAQEGLGGACHYCSIEAAEFLSQGLISISQAEALSLYCTACAGFCYKCRRSNLCLLHSRRFEDIDGKVLYLCPNCFAQAENEKFFKKTLYFMLSPFIDYRRQPPSKPRSHFFDD